MRKGVLGAVVCAAVTACAGQAAAAITLKFQLSQTNTLTGSYEVVLPYAPIYNATIPSEYVVSCEASYQGVARQCAPLELWPDTGALRDDHQDVWDAVAFWLDLRTAKQPGDPAVPPTPYEPAGDHTEAYYYFPNGAFGTPGTYSLAQSFGGTVATLIVSGSPDIEQPVPPPRQPSSAPEPSSWALLLLGFAGLGAMLRRERQNGRTAAGA